MARRQMTITNLQNSSPVSDLSVLEKYLIPQWLPVCIKYIRPGLIFKATKQ